MSNDRSESLNSIQVRELLEFYSELGLTETINEEPINRFELAKKINQESNLKKINTNISIQNGHFLHAQSISFSHPKTDEKVVFNAEPSTVFSLSLIHI